MGYRYGVRYRPMRHSPTITISRATLRAPLVRVRDIRKGAGGRQASFVDNMSHDRPRPLRKLRTQAGGRRKTVTGIGQEGAEYPILERTSQ